MNGTSSDELASRISRPPECTTLGMMLANIPAVIIGDRLAGKLPVKAIRIIAAIVFAALGIVTLSGLRL